MLKMGKIVINPTVLADEAKGFRGDADNLAALCDAVTRLTFDLNDHWEDLTVGVALPAVMSNVDNLQAVAGQIHQASDVLSQLAMQVINIDGNHAHEANTFAARMWPR